MGGDKRLREVVSGCFGRQADSFVSPISGNEKSSLLAISGHWACGSGFQLDIKNLNADENDHSSRRHVALLTHPPFNV